MGQNLLKGEIYVSDSLFLEEVVEIYEKELGYLGSTNLGGKFEILFDKDVVDLIFIANSYPIVEKKINLSKELFVKIDFLSRIQNLTEVIVNSEKREKFGLSRLKDYR